MRFDAAPMPPPAHAAGTGSRVRTAFSSGDAARRRETFTAMRAADHVPQHSAMQLYPCTFEQYAAVAATVRVTGPVAPGW
ncbi:hypothetical protein [Dactylosporangium sp. NPDC000521]|uniref:hypothetical protein n=1 Tax=Dactylosporangium sp. NPDC000521 TaxID=3363975 RepID=UPI0036BB0DE9